MELNERSDTLLNRLAELERLVQIQREEMRRIVVERDLLAAWYGATKVDVCRSKPVVAEEVAP